MSPDCPVCSLDYPTPPDQWVVSECGACGHNRFSASALGECRNLAPADRTNVSRGLAAVRRVKRPIFDVRVEQILALRDWPDGGRKLGG